VQETVEPPPPEKTKAEEAKQPEPEMSVTKEEPTETHADVAAPAENEIPSPDKNEAATEPTPEPNEEISDPVYDDQPNTIPEEEDKEIIDQVDGNRPTTIPEEEDEEEQQQAESSEPKTNGHPKEQEAPLSNHKEESTEIKRSESSQQALFQEVGVDTPDNRKNRYDRDESTTPSPGKPRRSRSVKDSFQAYYKVFRSRAYRTRSPSRGEATDEELQRLRKTLKTYEKQLEEASDTILLQDRVLTRWEKLGNHVCVSLV
jgi:hypothetical protein